VYTGVEDGIFVENAFSYHFEVWNYWDCAFNRVGLYAGSPVMVRCTLRNADCGMRNFEKVYFAESKLRKMFWVWLITATDHNGAATDHNVSLDTIGGSTPKFALKCTIIFCCILGGEGAQAV